MPLRFILSSRGLIAGSKKLVTKLDPAIKSRDDSVWGMTSKISIIIATLLALTSAPVYADNNSNNYTCSLTTVNMGF